jgi:hypothetical protein
MLMTRKRLTAVMAARVKYQNQRKVKIFSEMMFGAKTQR